MDSGETQYNHQVRQEDALWFLAYNSNKCYYHTRLPYARWSSKYMTLLMEVSEVM